MRANCIPPRLAATRRGALATSTPPNAIALLIGLWLIHATAPTAPATWSIVLVDTHTKEIAVGSATCLTNFDLQRWLPVVLVDIGAGCAQSFVDSSGQNRLRIWNELLAGTDPAIIIELLEANDSGHQTRQYGIADTLGRTATFTGTQASDWAGGVIGQSGNMAYAIQGNILTGEPVVAMALNAVLNTPGDLPDKLMAGMEAARAMGGDGRCSCPGNPTGCGSPPPDFIKAAHIAFMIDARLGDTDGLCNLAGGCATGDYFLDFNVAFQTANDEDPVLQMQALFDDWRASLVDRPDAVHSTATVVPDHLPANGASTATMTIELRDWQDTLLPSGAAAITVTHAADSDGLSGIGPVVDQGDGTYTVQLTAGGSRGRDRFLVAADDGVRPVTLIPAPVLWLDRLGDGDLDGDLDLSDFAAFLGCVTGPVGGLGFGGIECALFDFDVDNDVDLADVAEFQIRYTGACAEIVAQPESQDACPDTEVTFSVGVSRPDVTYQWSRDGVDIDGAVSQSYTIASAGESDEGAYTVRVTDFCTTTTSDAATLEVIDPPIILSQPSGASVCIGADVSLCIEASGYQPLTYQWFKDGVPIPGADQSCLVFAGLTQQDVGTYTVVVTDPCGSSVEATPMTVTAADVVITTHPLSQEVCTGATISLFVVTQNAEAFQWQQDGDDVPGATSPFLFIPLATQKHAGVYTCAVSNPCGTVTSNQAVVTVIDCPPP